MTRSLVLAFFLLHLSTAKAIPFFEIKKDGKSSYLLGTHHGVPGEVLPYAILKKLSESRHVFVETLMTEHDHFNEVIERLQRDYDPSRDNRKLLTTTEWLKLKRLINDFEEGWSMVFLRLRPASALEMLKVVFERAKDAAQNEGYNSYMQSLDAATDPESRAFVAELKALAAEHDPYRGEGEKEVIDDLVAKLGREIGANVGALDAEYQSAEREKAVTDRDVTRYARAGLRHHRTAERWRALYALNPKWVRSAMATATLDYLNWTPERNAAYNETFIKSEPLDPEERSKIHNRHASWMHELLTAVADAQTFIAVGLGHVMDDETEGLISLFERQGYEVTFAGNPCDLRLSSR